jgi:hypothetical protein
MAYDLFLFALDDLRSAARRKARLKELRQVALAIVPASDPLCEVGTINGRRFKIELRAAEAIVRADGIQFSIDDLQRETIPLLYQLARTGDMIITEVSGPSAAVVTDRAQLKRLPAEFQKPRPAVCTSPKELARLLGFSPKDAKPKRSKPDTKGLYQWSNIHDNRRFAHGDPEPRLPGLRDKPEERHFYLELKPNEGSLLLMKRFGQFLKEQKKQSHLRLPDGGGVGSTDWLIRLPTGQVLVPWSVTGYHWRPNTDHLIPANIEAWLTILRKFARQTDRATGSISGSKKFLLGDGRSYPLSACESRRARDEEG